VVNHAQKHGLKIPELNTGLAFPKVVAADGKDYGRMNGLMQSERPITSLPSSKVKAKLPKNAIDVFFDESTGTAAYTNPETGDIEYAEKSNIYLPQNRGNQ
jgi:hypothetical protein